MNTRQIILLCALTILFVAPAVLFAADAPFNPGAGGGTGGGADYVPIAPIPMGNSGQLATSGCLGDYINALFKLALAAGAALAAIYIAIGGFEYIFSEAMESKKDGRLRIVNALFGLGILLLVTIILYIINPNAINLNLFSGACS